MNADYFIKKFEAIPEEEWCEGDFILYVGPDRPMQRCAAGHCGATQLTPITPEASALSDVLGNQTVVINDGLYGFDSLGSHPKTRILAALHKAKEEGK